MAHPFDNRTMNFEIECIEARRRGIASTKLVLNVFEGCGHLISLGMRMN